MNYEFFVGGMDTHPALASWVQAFGSILALFLVIGVTWWQGRQSRKLFRDQVSHQTEEARLQRIASLRATVEVAEIVARRVVEIARKMPDIIMDGSALRHREALDVAVLWVSKLPIYELPGALVARDVQNIFLVANGMLRVLDEISTNGKHSDDSYTLLCGLSESAENTLAGLISFADNYTGGVEVIRAADL